MGSGVSSNQERLIGPWIHAHEEDTEIGQVFRPADYQLPPSRGREMLELRADGTFIGRRPGPTDEPVQTGGSWVVDGNQLRIREGDADQVERTMTIVESEPGRLVLRRSGGQQSAGPERCR
jgi:hypothetical protein